MSQPLKKITGVRLQARLLRMSVRLKLYSQINPLYIMSTASKRPRRPRKSEDAIIQEQSENSVTVDGVDLNPLLHAGQIARASGPSAKAGGGDDEGARCGA